MKLADSLILNSPKSDSLHLESVDLCPAHYANLGAIASPARYQDASPGETRLMSKLISV